VVIPSGWSQPKSSARRVRQSLNGAAFSFQLATFFGADQSTLGLRSDHGALSRKQTRKSFVFFHHLHRYAVPSSEGVHSRRRATRINLRSRAARGESRPTVSISYVRRVHASVAPELDVGTFRQSASILLSEDLHGFHFDANGIFAEQLQGAARRAQFGQTLSISHRLGKFTISGEVWHFSQPFERGNTVGNLWAVSRAIRKNLVVDAGFNRGLSKTSTRWEVFVGFTYLLPHRLWRVRRGSQP